MNSSRRQITLLIFLLSFGTSALVSIPALAQTPAASVAAPQSAVIDASAKERTRIEELFIWKASEELKLGAAEDLKFTAAIRSINTRRRAANVKMDAALAQLAKVKSKADAEKALTSHRAALRSIQGMQNAEVDELRPLIGAEKLAQYLVVKSTILEKLKSMLSAPAPASVAPEPVAPRSTESK